jgi:hypothetical protein
VNYTSIKLSKIQEELRFNKSPVKELLKDMQEEEKWSQRKI